MNSSEPFVLLDGSVDDARRIEPFLLLDGSVDDATRIVRKIDNAIDNPIVDKLYIKDVDLKNDNGREIKTSLQTLLLSRRWSAVDIDNCTGPIHSLISLVLESSPAGVVSLGLDSIVLDSDVELALERGIGINNNNSKTRLSTLQLLGCRLSASNVVSLLRGLKYNETIQTLNFHNSRFDHEAASELSKEEGGILLLHQCQSLRRLDFSGCHLPDNDVAGLVRSLSNHPNLEHLDLRQNICTTASASLRAIEYLLATTTTLRTLDLTLKQDAEIPCLNISAQKRRRTARHRSMKILYLRHGDDSIGEETGVEFSCTVCCKIVV
jgi:hypothetical protein